MLSQSNRSLSDSVRPLPYFEESHLVAISLYWSLFESFDLSPAAIHSKSSIQGSQRSPHGTIQKHLYSRELAGFWKGNCNFRRDFRGLSLSTTPLRKEKVLIRLLNPRYQKLPFCQSQKEIVKIIFFIEFSIKGLCCRTKMNNQCWRKERYKQGAPDRPIRFTL